MGESTLHSPSFASTVRQREPFFERQSAVLPFPDCLLEVREYVLYGRHRPLSGFEKYHLLPQVEFIPGYREDLFGVPLDPAICLNFMGRIEHFEDGFSRLCVQLNVSVPIEAADRHNYARSWRLEYSDTELEIVAEAYARDIDYLGYSFPSETDRSV